MLARGWWKRGMLLYKTSTKRNTQKKEGRVNTDSAQTGENPDVGSGTQQPAGVRRGRDRPKDAHLVCEGAHGGAEGPGQAKVGDLEGAVAANQQVLGLEIPVLTRRRPLKTKEEYCA